jgi:protein-tyrosine phosphatase
MVAGPAAVSRVLFVCLGNICRSPVVEVVARTHARRAGLDIEFASCGTGGWHVGKGADTRMRAAARMAGYDLEPHRARQLRSADLRDYDLVLAMDRDNLRDIERLKSASSTAHIDLFLPWAGVDEPAEFPDPYYGDETGFTASVALAERGIEGLLERLRHG